MLKSISVRIFALVLAVVLLMLAASCSASENSAADMTAPQANSTESKNQAGAAEEGYYDYDTVQKPAAEAESGNIADTRKIIRTVTLELETKTFNDAVALITASTASNGGYIEYSYVSGDSLDSNKIERRANFTIRIPASVLDSYINSLGSNFNVLSKTENSSDITDTYYDTEARLKSLQTQEERLLSMLEGATELQYMLQIEQTLAEVRYKIESYYSTMKRYDSQVSLSTIAINLYEVIEYQDVIEKPKTYGQRLGLAVKESWEDFYEDFKDFTVDLVYAIPTLIVVAALIVVAVLIIRRVTRRKNKGQ